MPERIESLSNVHLEQIGGAPILALAAVLGHLSPSGDASRSALIVFRAGPERIFGRAGRY